MFYDYSPGGLSSPGELYAKFVLYLDELSLMINSVGIT